MMMFSSTDKVKHNFTNSSFIATSLVLLLILFIRVTRGLDLSDEMQYYGEIKGLIETGKLFSNDLFIQQSVYILLYPAFYIYHSLFGFEGLVFFGRLLMAALSIAVYMYAYRKFLEFKFPAPIASLTALSLTFAIPYHGIFAPSYNTISQTLWIIFTIRFFEWKQRSAISWATIPVITAFAHPTSAVMMALLVLLRFLFERDFRQVAKVMLALLGGALVALPIIFYFATPQEYLASLAFSSGYGVGEVFFANKVHWVVLLFVYAIFSFSFFFSTRHSQFRLLILLVLGLSSAIVLYLVGIVGGGYSPAVVCVLSSLSAIAFSLAQSNATKSGDKLIQHILWLAVALLLFATTLGITSGNGIGQATGALMIALPLLLGVAVTLSPDKDVSDNYYFLRVMSVILVSILMVAHWSRYSYREDSWWRTNQAIQSVPEFRFINTTIERTEFIQRMRQALGTKTHSKKVLIVGQFPALYFVLDAIPETCMFFMHSLASDKSEKSLLNCLSKKQPDIIVKVSSDKDINMDGSRLGNVIQNYYISRNFDCVNDLVQLHHTSLSNPGHVKISVCNRRI